MHEAMTDLVQLMGTLVGSDGKIRVVGIMDDVVPVTAEEEALYEPIEFDLEEYKEENKVRSISNKLLHDNKKDLLMARWRYPTLSLHGIEGGKMVQTCTYHDKTHFGSRLNQKLCVAAFSGPGAKTVIPAKVIGKFSLRLVPDQDPDRIAKCVTAHVEREFQKVR